MKKNNIKKFLSTVAVLAISATSALAVIPFAACSNDNNSAEQPEKLITADKNHSAHFISTAQGTVRTESSGKVYYVAPNGGIANDGSTWDKPASLYNILGENSPLKAGDTVYVKPGTYEFEATITSRVSGEYNKYIRIVNAALENESGYQGTDKIVTLDFSKQFFASTSRGVQIYGDFVYWYGIDVCGAGDNGLYIGGSYNTVEFCEFYNNRDTGLQLGRAESVLTSIDSWPNYNLVKNCTSHNNYDNETYGENADGFAAKLTVGYGNVFDGCIAYRNSDDGWDLYAKSDSGNIGCVILYNCVAFENGYLEYTQEECNAKFPNYNNEYDEKFEAGTPKRYYLTRDGDGNGFKLGGSVMEGDVVMYNCLSFFNRMHGVTDNSNPGFIKVEGVTSYDNSAVIDENPESETFGQIVSKMATYKNSANEDVNWYKQENHGNVNVSRQTWSYNSVIKTLSVKSGYMNFLEPDEYRGSVTDSMLVGDKKQNVIEGSLDADSKNKVASTSTKELLVPSDVFKALPLYYTTQGEGVTATQTAHYNISGLKDLYASGTSGALNANRIHLKYRNAADGSINMHDILAKKDGVDGTQLISGKNIGSTLNLTSWEDYTHFYADDFLNGGAANADVAKVERIKETLTINTDLNAVYQDFEVPLKMKDCKISWASSNTDAVIVGTDVEQSVSASQYITITVNRPLEQDLKVTLTATITCGSASQTKPFELNIKAGQPTIGEISVTTKDGVVINDNSSLVVDQYTIFPEPVISVENGLDYNGKLLTSEQYTYTTKYMYAADKNSPAVEIAGFTPSHAGVYTITHTVKLTSNNTTKSFTYTLFVASSSGNVDFINKTNSVSVTRDGFLVKGSLSNATGYIYAVATNSQTKPTKDTIKTFEGVQYYTFRNDAVSFIFDNANSGEYTVYYALANLNGVVTSEVYEQKISLVEISTPADFMKIAGGGKIGEENPSTTIYKLTQDLDFNGVAYSISKSPFTGLLNGAGYTVKNVTVSGKGGDVGMFYRVNGGTVENIKFNNISINNVGGTKTGIVATTYGGYFHNIAITNVKIVSDDARTGGLIGQIFEGTATYISQVSLINDESKDDNDNLNFYISSGTKGRVGGLIGQAQTTSDPTVDMEIYISDCYVIANISGLEYIGGIIGMYDNAKSNINYTLKIERCYFAGVCSSSGKTPRVGGIIGREGGAVGSITITGCISIGKLYTMGVLVESALKTASPIFGEFSTTGTRYVSNCIGLMEEYNNEHDVTLYSLRNLQRNVEGIKAVLGEGWETKWTFVYDTENAEHPEYLKAPYLTLKFLEP